MKFKIFFSLVMLGLCLSGFKWFDSSEKEVFSGQIESKDSYFGSKIGGRVESILKHEGDVVTQGEVIIVFENKEQELRVALTKAKLEQAKTTLLKMQTGYQKEDIAIARAELATKNSALEATQKNYERQERLLKDKATTPKEHEESKNLFLQAKAQVVAAEQKLAWYLGGYRAEDVTMASEVLKEAEANVALALLDLEETRIVASSEGKIERITVQSGDLVAKNQSIVQVSNPKERYAKFYIPETQLHKVTIGQSVVIKIDGTDTKYQGEVFFIAQNAEFTPKNISTKNERHNLLFAIKAKVHDEGLKNGMFVEVSLP